MNSDHVFQELYIVFALSQFAIHSDVTGTLKQSPCTLGKDTVSFIVLYG